MPGKTVEGHDIGAREAALKKGRAAADLSPLNETGLQRRMKRLEKRLDEEGPDGPRGVRGEVRRPRSGKPSDRR